MQGCPPDWRLRCERPYWGGATAPPDPPDWLLRRAGGANRGGSPPMRLLAPEAPIGGLRGGGAPW
eukprot:1623974-Alexandrium_andersonii.AAC.1